MAAAGNSRYRIKVSKSDLQRRMKKQDSFDRIAVLAATTFWLFPICWIGTCTALNFTDSGKQWYEAFFDPGPFVEHLKARRPFAAGRLELQVFLSSLLSFGALVLLVSISVGSFITYVVSRIDWARRRKEELAVLERENALLSNTLEKTLSTAQSTLDGLPTLHRSASDQARVAAAEYEAKAYGPFWDALCNALQATTTFRDHVKHVADASKYYSNQLEGREHDLPPFPLAAGIVPDTAPLIRDLSALARKGQTNFEFAIIWEQRRTQFAIQQGFKNLSEAVWSVAGDLRSSLEDLGVSLSASLDAISSEEERTRDELTTAVHDLGEHLKPT